MRQPHFDEIKSILIDLKIMDENHSDDILRIDLNTIKLMGCEISRPTPSSDYKYILTKHPFCLSVPEKELLILKKAYSILKQKADLTKILEYHQLFHKIAFHICDEETKEALLGISVLKQLINTYQGGNYIYLADNLHMPYGNKSKPWLTKRMEQLINYLETKYNVNHIVVACNTASTVVKADAKVQTMKFVNKLLKESQRFYWETNDKTLEHQKKLIEYFLRFCFSHFSAY